MDTRMIYVEKVAARLLEWDKRIDELMRWSELAPPESRIRYRQQLVSLREKREEGARILAMLHEADAREWPAVKARADGLLEDEAGAAEKAA